MVTRTPLSYHRLADVSSETDASLVRSFVIKCKCIAITKSPPVVEPKSQITRIQLTTYKEETKLRRLISKAILTLTLSRLKNQQHKVPKKSKVKHNYQENINIKKNTSSKEIKSNNIKRTQRKLHHQNNINKVKALSTETKSKGIHHQPQEHRKNQSRNINRNKHIIFSTIDASSVHCPGFKWKRL